MRRPDRGWAWAALTFNLKNKYVLLLLLVGFIGGGRGAAGAGVKFAWNFHAPTQTAPPPRGRNDWRCANRPARVRAFGVWLPGKFCHEVYYRRRRRSTEAAPKRAARTAVFGGAEGRRAAGGGGWHSQSPVPPPSQLLSLAVRWCQLARVRTGLGWSATTRRREAQFDVRQHPNAADSSRSQTTND